MDSEKDLLENLIDTKMDLSSAVQHLALGIRELKINVQHMDKEIELGHKDTNTRLKKIESSLWESNGQKALLVRFSEVEKRLKSTEEKLTNLVLTGNQEIQSIKDRRQKLLDNIVGKLIWFVILGLAAATLFAFDAYLEK